MKNIPNTKTEKRKHLDKLLKIITKECENKNWHWVIDALDGKEFLSATIRVEKSISSQGVSALLNVLIRPDKTIQYGIEKTSFYGYGVDALFSAITNALKSSGYVDADKKESQKENMALGTLVQMFKRFHVSALQLAKRYNNREPFLINDEYDVQDYIHALLKIYFNDIRPEEYAPSYAGSASKIDFLLKDEKILLETKYATTKLKDKKIGEQLIIDTERYKSHPDCEHLVCFVYDPNFNIKNPYGIEKDLSGKKDKLNVKVYIYPK
jgi:hypothetical protein